LSQISGTDSEDDDVNDLNLEVPPICDLEVSHTRSCFEPLDIGCPTSISSHCGAIICKVQLPLLKETPEFLRNLLDCKGGQKSSNYMESISIYNSMFAFTSTGGAVQSSINDGKGLFVYKIKGQNHHKIGTLLPPEGVRPRFAQLYIHDTENEVSHRLNSLNKKIVKKRARDELDPSIVQGLIDMLNVTNKLTETYRMARDRFKECHVADISIKLINRRQKDGRLYNLPSSTEVAGLIVGNGDEFNVHRDVIVDKKRFGLKRINELWGYNVSVIFPIFPRPGFFCFVLVKPVIILDCWNSEE
ncbi:hypothetical protein IFM89_033881, partial [Coptis chinensis]